MAVGEGVTAFEEWYDDFGLDERTGTYRSFVVSAMGNELWNRYNKYKREMDVRVANFDKLEKLADGEVISPKHDLPNVSSGETAGLIRRIARNLVQNTPNVEVISRFDDDAIEGVFARHVLTSKIIGSDSYSNDMQQNLFASTKTALTLGFDAVIPVLLQDAGGSWYMKYDAIHYRDVYPEPGCRDVRDSTEVFVRRHLTVGEVKSLAHNDTVGWDRCALMTMLQSNPPTRDQQSRAHADKKTGTAPEGYPVITWYSSSGAHFLTFCERTKMLLRIERNKHPMKKHPVFFLVLEKDNQQPLGKSQVELLTGRQDFQDLMLNGAMKLWYRNINPSIIGYGTTNAIPNLSPGKYTQIANPNARIEPFEVNTGTLMQYGQISQQNLGSMVSMIGAADQQMATQSGAGMSATPQGVEAQQAMVDITTNNYQKAIEGFFSHYCSYALTMFFHELKSVKTVAPTADARVRLLRLGFPLEQLKDDGTLDIDFEPLATEYFVRCVPGSLVEMEDEKQLRILNQMFIPLSQALPAMAQAGDPQMLKQAAAAMQYIITKQIELSGSSSTTQLKQLWERGDVEAVTATDERIAAMEAQTLQLAASQDEIAQAQTDMMLQMKEQISLLTQSQGTLLDKLGAVPAASVPTPNSSVGV